MHTRMMASCVAVLVTTGAIFGYGVIVAHAGPAGSGPDGGRTPIASDAESPRSAAEIRVVAEGPSTVRFSAARPAISMLPDAKSGAVSQTGLRRPLAAAASRFDSDGIVDLVVGYETDEDGALVVYRGNPAFRESAKTKRLRRAAGYSEADPFLDQTVMNGLGLRPDFVVAGDFDADSLADVVIGERGRSVLSLFRGNGRGEFEPPLVVHLPGGLTAMAAGEIGHYDTLADLAVGVRGAEGSSVRVYSSVFGAFAREPMVVSAPESVSGIVVGTFDEGSPRDIACACGDKLLLIRGRERLDPDQPVIEQEIAPGKVEIVQLDGRALALTAGDFVGDARDEVAVVTTVGGIGYVSLRKDEQSLLKTASTASGTVDAVRPGLVRTRVSGNRYDDFVVVDEGDHLAQILSKRFEGEDATRSATKRIGLVSTAPVRVVVPMRLNGDALDDLVLLTDESPVPTVLESTTAATFTVNATDQTNDGSCDTAHCSLREAITAANNSAGVDTIEFEVASAPIVLSVSLPTVDDPVIVDGVWGTYPALFRTEIDGDGRDGTGLWIVSGSTTLRALVVGNNEREGIFFQEGGDNLVANCYIGTTANGLDVNPNHFNGIHILRSSGNTIGGTVFSDRNVISGNGTIQQNNANIRIEGSSGSTIDASDNWILGNYVGIDKNGASALTNPGDGVALHLAEDNHIGALDGGNVISGNGANGVRINYAEANYVVSNRIGLNAGGSAPVGNTESGVWLSTAHLTYVGGVAAVGNVISGNGEWGVKISEGAGSGTSHVKGNHIGTDPDGTMALANGSGGILVDGVGACEIGGVPAEGNLISGNAGPGLSLVGSEAIFNLVYSNRIGTDASGASALPNTIGVSISGGARENYVGGSHETDGNLISGNSLHGIAMGDGARVNRVFGNLIGTDATGTNALGNGGAGVLVGSAEHTFIGFYDEWLPNVIAHNQDGGVVLGAGAQSINVRANRIFGNTGLGIDLGDDGVTANDPGDRDAGANELQNFPIIISATTHAGQTTIQGTLNSMSNTDFEIDFYAGSVCDASGYGEGAAYLDRITVTTTPGGDASFQVTMPAAVSTNDFITATATRIIDTYYGWGHTSEFSACAIVSEIPGAIFADDFESGDTTAWSQTR